MKFALALIAFAAAVAITEDLVTEGNCVDTAACPTVNPMMCCMLTDAATAANSGKYCIKTADATANESFTDAATPPISWTANSCYVAPAAEDSATTLVAGAAAVATLALF